MASTVQMSAPHRDAEQELPPIYYTPSKGELCNLIGPFVASRCNTATACPVPHGLVVASVKPPLRTDCGLCLKAEDRLTPARSPISVLPSPALIVTFASQSRISPMSNPIKPPMNRLFSPTVIEPVGGAVLDHPFRGARQHPYTTGIHSRSRVGSSPRRGSGPHRSHNQTIQSSTP